MRRHEVTGLLSISIVIAFAAGATIAAWQVSSHGYVKYGLYRLAALSVSRLMAQSVVIAVVLVVLCCVYWCAAKRLWNYLLSRRVKAKGAGEEDSRIWAAYILSFAFFSSLWAAGNHYWISYRWYHPKSLPYDAGILVVAILFGWFLAGFPVEKMFVFLKRRMVKWAAVALMAAALILNAGLYIDARINPPKGPDIILITIETLRADHLGCYGYSRNTSPTIDAVAADGVLFSRMFAQRALTWPSLTSIMTSMYPVNHGVRDNGDLLCPSVISLAEILKNEGYLCGAFLAHGGGAEWRGFDRRVEAAYEDDLITGEAIEWLKSNRGRKLFLWIHYFEPHKPYQPPPPYDRVFDPGYEGPMNGSAEQLDSITLNKVDLASDDLNHIISLYDGSILVTDNRVKRVLDTIGELGLDETSLVIISADHGEDLYQHNYYFYHTSSIYDSSLHIPFIVKFPRGGARKKVVGEVVQSIDIAPTILEIAGIARPGRFEGSSLAALTLPKRERGDFGLAFSEWEDKMLSVRTGAYRYIYNPGEYHPKSLEGATEATYPVEREELYDVVKDPAESKNIISEESAQAKDLMGKIMEWEYFPAWSAGESPAVGEASDRVKEQLRALGYI